MQKHLLIVFLPFKSKFTRLLKSLDLSWVLLIQNLEILHYKRRQIAKKTWSGLVSLSLVASTKMWGGGE